MLVVLGSFVCAQKGAVVGITPADVDLIEINEDMTALPSWAVMSGFRIPPRNWSENQSGEAIRCLAGQGLPLDHHSSAASLDEISRTRGIFQKFASSSGRGRESRLTWAGWSPFQAFRMLQAWGKGILEPMWHSYMPIGIEEWLATPVSHSPFEIRDLRPGIAHRLRGVRYFGEGVTIPKADILLGEVPVVSLNRYDPLLVGSRDVSSQLLLLGKTRADGFTDDQGGRYGGGFDGNTPAAILAAIRKVCGWGISTSLIREFEKWVPTLERAVEALEGPEVLPVERGNYGPRANMAGLRSLIETGTLTSFVNGQINLR